MTSIGETLRRERLKRNLDLEQISSELKISSRLLEAIESEQFDKLPGGVFAKSFVRQYARLLGLDEEDLVDQVQRVLEPSPGVPQNPDVSAIHVPKVEEWETVSQDRFQLSGSLPAAVMVVIVMLVCSGVYAWLQRPQAPVSAQASPVENAAPPPQPATPPTPPVATPAAPPDAASPPPADPGASNRAPETPPQQPGPATTAAPALPAASAAPRPVDPVVRRAAPSNPSGGVRVEVTAEETVWILARADGKFAFSGTLEAQQTRTVEAASEVVLRLGNAGGVTIQVNGKSIGPAGPKGQVRTLQFTSGGFHIVPAKPPAVPFDPLDRL